MCRLDTRGGGRGLLPRQCALTQQGGNETQDSGAVVPGLMEGVRVLHCCSEAPQQQQPGPHTEHLRFVI